MWKLLLLIDRKINDDWLGGHFETISGRCYRTQSWLCRKLCKWLDKIDPGHCKKSYESDRIRNPNLPI